ncbi:sigma-54 interaction domain-containing protein [Dethiobacter alkaliphilus]|uniref:sigma-54 interaction domain-containing protein n=1 Tax=Dethiobacter alkaliphilus TaxID=427926 RepID=UPI002226B9CB|nr:sigma 54-interacting transcriptional regulator [Dethiobacter alkaliphilus]MCW3490360.1 sigma 54-interacting transcriptional regulator [Dethiobacter alkaliphilus]
MNKGNVIHITEVDEVRRLKKELDVIIESSYDGIILSDREGRIFRANQSMERVSGGIKVEDLLGKTALELEKEGIILSQSKIILGKDPLTLKQNIRTGVELFITSKPAYDDRGRFLFYVATIRDMTELSRLRQEVEETKDQSFRYYQELLQLRGQILEQDEMVVISRKMKDICERAIRVAQTDTNVLISGPSGSGKEMIAKLIHNSSPRKSGPFVQINCGAIPETLLESELFGYEKGAFTGAGRQGKIGLMEMADLGTILLDEIGDLSPMVQVKLLRAIQEQVIYRVGSTTPIKLNVRIIAATNKNLEKMVEENLFREDLYYRLNVIPIHIPPLRERREAIVPLALHFLKSFNQKHGSDKSLSPEVCACFEEYDWPGNVRELENLIERMVVISDEKVLTPYWLPRNVSGQAPRSDMRPKQECTAEISLKQAREDAERDAIDRALSLHGSIRKAAKSLGVDHSTVVRKMKSLGLEHK